MAMNRETNEGAFNARNSNNSPYSNIVSGGNTVSGGNVKRLERQIQINELNGVSDSPTNGDLSQPIKERNLNRKSSNDRQFIIGEPISKGTEQEETSKSHSRKRKDGAQQSAAKSFISSLSKTIGSYLEGGRPSSSKSTSEAPNNGKSLDINCDKTNNISGLKVSTYGGHNTNEKVDEPSNARGGSCSGATGLKCIFGQNQPGIDSVKILPFKLGLHRSGGVFKSGKGRSRVRFKDVAKRKNISGGPGSNGGNSSSNKNPKRSLEVRDTI
ncbi:hypothetical protein MKX01_041187 [Papaver californicum]|nr:hypothetical protein MKX01_041187 [Papaver californicum]